MSAIRITKDQVAAASTAREKALEEDPDFRRALTKSSTRSGAPWADPSGPGASSGDLDPEKLDRGCFDQDPLKTLRRARLLVIRRVMVQEYLAHRCPSSAKGADRMHGPRSLVSSGTEARISPSMLPPVGLR